MVDEDTLVQTPSEPSRPRRRGRAVLTILSGRDVGKTFKVTGHETVIGRASDADLQIVDDGVSRRHARLVREPDGMVKVHDLRSTNGTYINGKRVDLEVLREGDRLRVGQSATIDIRYEYVDADADPDEASPQRGWSDNLASTLDSLGKIYDTGGHYDEAIRAYRRTLSMREENLGPRHPSVASILSDIGSALRAKGDLAEGLRHHQRALTIYEDLGSGPAPPEMAHILTNIGECHLDLGDAEAAIGVLDRALEMLEARRAGERELATVRFAMARALKTLRREPVRARSLAQMARDALLDGQDGRARVIEIDRWLTET